jgi:hypothetical protein
MSDEDSGRDRTHRWRRRAERLRSERERMKKHGATIRRVYRDAVLKRRRKGSA